MCFHIITVILAIWYTPKDFNQKTIWSSEVKSLKKYRFLGLAWHKMAYFWNSKFEKWFELNCLQISMLQMDKMFSGSTSLHLSVDHELTLLLCRKVWSLSKWLVFSTRRVFQKYWVWHFHVMGQSKNSVQDSWRRFGIRERQWNTKFSLYLAWS